MNPVRHCPLTRVAARIFAFAVVATSALAASTSTSPSAPQVVVVEGGDSKTRPEDCRAVLVGPGINQPDPFPGYGGFVGWESPVRLKNGDWLVGFNAGYWHASAPTPLRYPAKTLEEYLKLGLPAGVVAPTGGRAMIMRSTDQGKTWSKPVTLIDTPADDRHPAFVELRDGTLLCSFFSYMGEPEGGEWKDPALAVRVHLIRSFDGGRTWEKKPSLLRTPFTYDETDGPLVRLKNGSVLIAINGRPRSGPPDQAAVLRTTNRGRTWKTLGTVQAAHDLQEVTVAELPGDELVMMARPEGDICWSRDQGRTWTAPVTFSMRMFAPSLYVLQDGTLLCLHGSYGRGGLRVIFSRDGGHTWIAPGKDHGFLVDQSYGYGKAMELSDGSLFVTYLATGGHHTSDAQANAIRCIRLRVRPDYSGIDLLPAPNRGLPVSVTNAPAPQNPPQSGKRLLPATTKGNGLGNTFSKLKQGKNITIGYFGGSITTGVGSSNPDALSYRALTTGWFRTQYPGMTISEANAAIGGTGSVIGASRIDKDLIPSHPDLVLIEFAVNDNGADRDTLGRAMERIIRTLRTRLPDTDILMVYTMQADRMYDFYKSGETPDSVVYHQRVAEHYGCSSVNVGEELFNKIHSKQATWNDLAPDTCHPSDAGYRVYFEQLRDFLEKHKADKPRKRPAPLPKPLYPENAQQP